MALIANHCDTMVGFYTKLARLILRSPKTNGIFYTIAHNWNFKLSELFEGHALKLWASKFQDAVYQVFGLG